MDDRPFIRLPRLLGLLAIAFLLASCTKFHVPDTPPVDNPIEEAPAAFTPEELGDIVAAHVIDDLDVGFSAEGIRLTWIGDDTGTPAYYWVLATIDGENFAPVHMFETNDVAHISTLSTHATILIRPYDEDGQVPVIYNAFSGWAEALDVPFLDPTTDKLLISDTFFSYLTPEPDLIRQILEELHEDFSNLPDLLEDYWPSPRLRAPPTNNELTFEILSRSLSLVLARMDVDYDPDFLPTDTPPPKHIANEILQELLEEQEAQQGTRRRPDNLTSRREVVIEPPDLHTLTLDAFTRANGTKLDGTLVILPVDESIRVAATPVESMSLAMMYTPMIYGSPVFYSPQSARESRAFFELSSNVPGYAVVAERGRPQVGPAFAVCIQEPTLSELPSQDPFVPSCNGSIDDRNLRIADDWDGTGDILLIFRDEPTRSQHLDKNPTMRVSIVLPGESAQFAAEPNEEGTSFLTIPATAENLEQPLVVKRGDRDDAQPIIIAIEVFVEGVQKPVFWDVYELDVTAYQAP